MTKLVSQGLPCCWNIAAVRKVQFYQGEEHLHVLQMLRSQWFSLHMRLDYYCIQLKKYFHQKFPRMRCRVYILKASTFVDVAVLSWRVVS